jgi:hypothetical protein
VCAGFLLTHDRVFLEPWQSARSAFPASSSVLVSLEAHSGSVAFGLARKIRSGGEAYISDFAVPEILAVEADPASATSLASALDGKRRVDALRPLFTELIKLSERPAAPASTLELSRLARSFNTMAHALQDTHDRLQAQTGELRRSELCSPVGPRGSAMTLSLSVGSGSSASAASCGSRCAPRATRSRYSKAWTPMNRATKASSASSSRGCAASICLATSTAARSALCAATPPMAQTQVVHGSQVDAPRMTRSTPIQQKSPAKARLL